MLTVAGFRALACAKTWLNAWTTTRHMHDSRRLPFRFGCADPSSAPVPDAMSNCLQCDILWTAACRAAGDGPGRSAIERVALGDALDLTERIGAVARLIC